MANLDDLLRLEGVVAAGEFSPDGRLIDYRAKGEMSRETAEASAHFCATVSMLFATLAGAFTQLSGMNWLPPRGWMYAGGDYTVAIGGNRGVFAETRATDFNRLYGALVGDRS